MPLKEYSLSLVILQLRMLPKYKTELKIDLTQLITAGPDIFYLFFLSDPVLGLIHAQLT